MSNGHLTIEWLKMYLLQQITLTHPDRDHLVGCAHCMKLLAQASLELAKAAERDSEEEN